jgi:iduronate 2-sulfatase
MTARCWLLAFLFLAASSPAAPNVLFIIADDLRPDLGCYGNPVIKSPNIDKLAARGLIFERAYCQVALCNPSRTSFLTGRRPDATGVFDNGANFRAAHPEWITLPQWFKQHGYHAQAVGKVFHPGCDDADSWSAPPWDPQHSTPGTATGEALIEEMKGYYGRAGQIAIQHRAAQLIVSGQRTLETLKRRDLLGAPWEITDGDGTGSELADARTAERAVTTLRAIKDRPFFLAVGFLKPHLPFVAPRKYWDLYPLNETETLSTPPPRGAPPAAMYDSNELRAYEGVPPKGPLPEEDARQLVRGYRAAVSFMDAQVGRVLDEIDQLGLRENTIVVLLGDHGWQLGEHGIWCKHTNFELATRAPLIITSPHMKAAGQRTPALVELVDLFPTLTALAGLPAPADLDGTSLAPLLNHPDSPGRRGVFSQFLRPGKPPVMGRSVRTTRWRYTEWTKPDGESAGAELYDEENDPGESRNLAAEKLHAETVSTLRALLAGKRSR